MALIKVFPPSANEPAVAASTGVEAETKERSESGSSIVGQLGQPQE